MGLMAGRRSFLLLLVGSVSISGFSSSPAFLLRRPVLSSSSQVNAVGVYFGTSTGNTEEVADLIVSKLNELSGAGTAVGPFSVDDKKGSLASSFAEHDALILGTPTWNTGADTERSGVAWDEVYYKEMATDSGVSAALKGKSVAVYGLGDSSSYGENYCDATGELHDVFEKMGAKMMGYVDIDESYKHEDSKAIRGEKFCGLLCDNVNQAELTDGRVSKWLEQLLEEGLLEGVGEGKATADEPKPAKAAAPQAPTKAAPVAPAKTAATAPKPSGSWVGHYNPAKKSTMWVSASNRRDSFVTTDK